jgi:transposase
LDTGDKYGQVCIRDGAGDISAESQVRMSRAGVRKYFGTLVRCRVALEVGTHSRWIAQELEALGFEVYVANARKLRAIYQSDTKTDKCDARFLAEVVGLKPSLLCPIKHRGDEAQADLAVIRARGAFVRTRTLLINHVRATVKSMGGRLAKCSSESFHKQLDAIPEERRPILAPVMKQLLEITAHIRGYDKAIEERLATYPEGKLLMQIAGVGPQVALGFICTIEDPHRFKNVRKIGSYLGLRPRIDQSGEVNKQLRITKAGDSDLRRLLVNSAQYILGPHGPECDLRDWGIKLVERGGTAPKKKAVIAVARKLAVLLLSLWKTGATYEPSRRAKDAAAAAAGPATDAAADPTAAAAADSSVDTSTHPRPASTKRPKTSRKRSAVAIKPLPAKAAEVGTPKTTSAPPSALPTQRKATKRRGHTRTHKTPALALTP